jgi:hypothetical protein
MAGAVNSLAQSVPMITAITAPRQVVGLGQSLTLSATATGGPPLSYQWMHSGLPIPGATSADYVIERVLPNDRGWYHVVVSNSAGSATSAVVFVLVDVNPAQVVAWGYDQPDTNQTSASDVPSGLTDIVSISAFAKNAGAVRGDGSVVVWGDNAFGQTAVPAGLNNVVSVVLNAASVVALKADGTVVGWGTGVGAGSGANVPIGLSNVVQIAGGTEGFYVALKSDGTLVAWGFNPQGGGNNLNFPAGLNHVVAVSLGTDVGLALMSDGTLAAWGLPVGVAAVAPELSNLVAISVAIDVQGGTDFAVGLEGDGTVVAWGNNSSGQLDVPAGLDNVVSVATGSTDSLALKGDGTVVAWGPNSAGELNPPHSLDNVVQVAAGETFFLALRLNSTNVFPPVITTQPVGSAIAFGASTTLSVAAQSFQSPTYQWQVSGVNIAGATSSTYTTSQPGSYTVVVTNSGGSVTSNAAVVTAATRLANVSSRAFVGSGAEVEIAGFVVSGPPGSTEQVLVRGIGPALSQFGVSNVLTTPVLTLFDSAGNVVATNTGWSTSANATQIASAAAVAGAFALSSGSADSAMLVSLAPGSYTAEVSGLNGATGVALAEVYEMSAGSPELINISARAFVGSGSSVEIAGIVISGSQPAKVLIRAVGPTLSQFGVTGVLAQPALSVVNSSGVTVASNTGWLNNPEAATMVSEAAAVGAFALPTVDADSALLVTLPPGTYTAVVSGVGGTTGVALVEVYQAP